MSSSSRRRRRAAVAACTWLLAVRTVAQQAVQPRWGQASLLTVSDGAPSWHLVSGKTFVPGQTVDSSPTSDDVISLSLAQPIPNLNEALWSVTKGAPVAAYGSAVSFGSSGLFFGGDAAGDPSTPLQSGNDSGWTTTTGSTWQRQQMEWASQPQRRQKMYSASASNGTTARAWFYGGQRTDSLAALSELWTMEVPVTTSGDMQVDAARWQQLHAEGGPLPMYDGAAVLVPGSSGEQPTVYLIGGVQTLNGDASLASMSTIWSFTASATSPAEGVWKRLQTRQAPRARRGHVAVVVDDHKIWIEGGRDLSGDTVFDDAAILDVRSRTWSAAPSETRRWAHSATYVGGLVVVAFGYGQSGPALPDLAVYSPANDTWLQSFTPVLGASSAGSANDAPSVSEDGAHSVGTPQEGSSAVGAAVWTVPGAPLPTSRDEPSKPNDASKDGSSTTSPGVIAGAVSGSFVALALVAAALFLRYRRTRGGAGRWQAYKNLSDGRSGLISRASSMSEKPVSVVTMRSLASGRSSIGRVLPSWIRARSPGAQRFDILQDEEWSPAEHGKGMPSSWQAFADTEGQHDRSMRGRGGRDIWSLSADGAGLTRSSSFLGSSLGAFATTANANDAKSDVDLSPIAEDDESRSMIDHGTTDSHESSARSSASPSASTFLNRSTLVPASVALLASATSLTKKLSRSTTWWIGRRSPSAVNETAEMRIRDPTPAPALDPFLDQHDDDNPFADPSDQPSRLTADDALAVATHATHDRSISSARSQATAASSALEEKMRHLDVAERVKEASPTQITDSETVSEPTASLRSPISPVSVQNLVMRFEALSSTSTILPSPISTTAPSEARSEEVKKGLAPKPKLYIANPD